jgi:hypothetical protein
MENGGHYILEDTKEEAEALIETFLLDSPSSERRQTK